ncbi:glycosyltransferase family 2 protein [Nocardioides sp.]|uniref:glycosyltransferase family 2 protein n=1 Tax=Nocardioides sp. TaxID=35761 RepID=UPI001A183216|nr:glycosyltransferase family 2 protein [Nocardioides sp.]MBJ7358435.1 glycosyltransferase family 2 protein [Nocardioides sp.]
MSDSAAPSTGHRAARVGGGEGPAGGEDVAVLLVSHDGASWLPTVLAGLAEQQAPIATRVAVDTGSKDESPRLLADAFGADHVVPAPSSTTYPAAVRLGLERLAELAGRDGSAPEWVWLLHDDTNPHPEALLALLAGTAEHPDADVLGPMLREWPSLKAVLELGVTISGTGRRETGLERGEYDQGQYAEVRPVLAVNTAGMLVRRRVLEALGGFDDELPMFGNDLDFGWRAAAAGHRTIVVPQAVVFHAEAAHRGVRQTPLTGRHTHYQERRAALFTLLANGRPRRLPLQVVRLTLGTFVRMLGFLLVRSPGEALDDLAALVSVLRHPGHLLAARRARQAAATADVRPLLPPWWLPYRHGLDFLRDLGGALGQQAADVADRRRAAQAEQDPESFAARRTQQLERLSGDGSDDELIEDSGLVARFFTNPVAVLVAVFVLVALAASRGALGEVAGGGLSPVPDGVGSWWRLHTESWHPLGQGTGVPAPAYLLPLALVATVLGGSPAAAVSLLLVLAVPGAAWGAWRFLRVAGRLVRLGGAPRWVILWGSTTYALVPVVAGGWGDGRLGLVVAAVLLPWLAHAALGFADPVPDRRWRAAWRSGVLLAVVTAFTPAAWVFAVLLGGVVVTAAFRLLPSAMGDRSTWGPPAAAVGVVPLLLAPWWVSALTHGAGSALLLDAGRVPGPAADGLDLLAGRLGDLGAPWWLGAVVPVLAVLALVPRATRIPVLIAWMVAVVAALVALLLSFVRVDLLAGSSAAGQGFLLVVLQGALLVAASLGALGLVQSRMPRWRSAVAVAAAGAAVAVPVGGLAWFLTAGQPELDERLDPDIPAYMVQSSEGGPEHGILVVRGSVDQGLRYLVRREDGFRLGEDEIVAHSEPDARLDGLVRSLVSRPTPAEVSGLGDAGIEYVVLPAPADPDVAAVLDATSGLEAASAEDRGTRAWLVDRPLSADELDGPRSWLRIALLAGQAVAVVTVLVLCAPTTSRTSSRRQR